MRRLTGMILFSLLSLLPLEANSAKSGEKSKICPSGYTPCPQCGPDYPCLAPGLECPQDCQNHKTHTLKKLPNTSYTAEDGVMVRCETGKTFTPLPGGTYWTCGSKADKGSEKP